MFLHIMGVPYILEGTAGQALRGARGIRSPIPAVEQGGPVAPGSGGGGVVLGAGRSPHTTIVVLL